MILFRAEGRSPGASFNGFALNRFALFISRGADDCKVEFDQNESGIRVYSHYAGWRNSSSSSLRFEIKVPKRFDLEFDSMGGGIAIDGWVRAETMGGDVDVTMVGDPAKGRRDVDLSSKSGDITLIVPADLSMDVHVTLAQTRNAHKTYRIISDFSLDQEESKEWDYDNGTPRKYIYATGSIAAGKNKITIETINGDVYLKKGKP